MRCHCKASTSTISVHGSTSRLGRRANTCPRIWFTATLPGILRRENQAVGCVCLPGPSTEASPTCSPAPPRPGPPLHPEGPHGPVLTLHAFH